MNSLFKIGDVWITLDKMTWALDDASTERLTVFFGSDDHSVRFRDDDRGRMLYLLGKETTEML